MAQKGAAGAGTHEWERSWGAPAQGTRLQRGRCHSMEDDAPVIYGLEFQVGPGTAPRRPVPPRSLRRGLGGPKAAVIQERPRARETPGGRGGPARDPRPWEPPPPACRPGVPYGLTLTAVLACVQFREPCCSWRQAPYLY